MTPAERFIQLVKHPVKFRLFLLMKLPSAFFCGVRIKSFNADQAVVTVPYKWLSQNPFKSTYFACLAMAAEMSTGLLAMMNTHERKPAVSMLVTNLEANYFKKATGITYFTCNDGEALQKTVSAAIVSGEGQVLRARSTGCNEQGELIAEFYITWSFKAKQAKV
jgi:acyl-coenzyme A thioesterase PaaI-like protein